MPSSSVLYANFEVVTGCIAAFVSYVAGVWSLGRLSLTHGWLFTGLTVWKPAEASLSRILGTNAQQRVPARQRLDVFRCTSTRILPGGLLQTIIEDAKAERRLTGRRHYVFLDQYRTMATAVAWSIAALLVLWLRWLGSIGHYSLCESNDETCWAQAWLRSKTTWLLVAFVFGILLAWWHLALLVSRKGHSYPPSAYMAAISFGIMAWFFSISGDKVSLGIDSAIREMAVRSFFWLRLFGISRISTEDIEHLYLGHRMVLCSASALIGFATAEPLHTLIKAVTGDCFRARCDRNDDFHALEGAAVTLTQTSLQVSSELALLVGLPLLALATYSLNKSSLPLGSLIRAALTVVMIALFALVVRRLLQRHLDSALPAARAAVEQLDFDSDVDPYEQLTLPFQMRLKSLPHYSGKLLGVPVFLVVLLMVGSLSAAGCHRRYPSQYGGHLVDSIQTQQWENYCFKDWRYQREWTCGSMVGTDLLASNENEIAQLLGTWEPPSVSFIQALKELQRSLRARMKEEQEGRGSRLVNPFGGTRSPQPTVDDAIRQVKDTAFALVAHPFVSARTAYVLVDFFGFMLCSYWLFWGSYAIATR